MANFCKYCGTPLQEGYICGCPQAQADYQAQQQAAYQAQQPAYQAPAAPQYAAAPVAAPAAPAAGNDLVKSLKDTLLGYWKSPKAAAYAAAGDKNGFATAGIFAGVNFLAVFFFLWRIIGMLLSGIAKTGDADLSDLKDMLEIEEPIFPMLIAGLGIAVLGILLTALVVFIGAKLNKQNADFKQLIVIEAVHSVVPTALLLAGIVLGFIVWWMQFLVLAIILVLWFVNVLNDIRDITGVQLMADGKTMVINTLVIFAVLAVGAWLMTAIGGWSVGELSIQDMTMNEVIDKAGGIMDMLGSGMF